MLGARMLRRWADLLLPGLLILALAAVQAADPRLLAEARGAIFDSYQRLKPRPFLDTPVRIVDIDDESLARLGQWPWSRARLAELIGRLEALGAAAVGLDIVLAEPDRTAPAALAEAWPAGPDWQAARDALTRLPDPDAALAEALQRLPIATAFAATQRPGGRAPALKAGFAVAGEDPGAAAPAFAGAVPSLPILEGAAEGNGAVNSLAEGSGVVRRVPLLVRIDGQLYPSFAAELLRVAQGAAGYVVKGAGASGEGASGGTPEIAALRIGRATVPTDGAGGLILYDSGSRAERYISAWRVLDGSADPAALSGALVLIGGSAAALQDVRATPLSGAMPGVEIHAQLLEQMIGGQFLSRPGWAPGAEILATLAGGMLLIFLLRSTGALRSALAAALLAGIAVAGSVLAFTRLGWLVDPVTPSLAVLSVYLLSSTLGRLRTERDRRQVREAFSRYLSPVLVDQLAARPERLALGGENRELTLLFSDIRGFTSFSEEMEPQELGRFMNAFLTPMTAAIQAQGGTIDKYIGDCVMAFWNAPLDDPDHASHALQAALEMRAALAAFNAARPERPAVQIGIGINTGLCAVGNFGSEQRFDYSAMGDAVNAASRFESLSKHYGVDIVVGEGTAERARGRFALLPIDRIRVKGKHRPALLHALIGGAELLSQPAFRAAAETQEALLAAYAARQWSDAARLAARLAELDGGLGRLAALYRERIAGFMSNPPAPDWDGVAVAAGKHG
ncbi:MAG TPA: adenylate/guanylate cyclase domain-containing protein [Methylomirabilota bacterium]|jgi:adenylate cyclase|nr:adenylate/guanylate cyclase domain-containing protein [Methylomirabilota bacterium]